MKSLVWFVKSLLKAAVFFTLFAFALNNQGDVTVHLFFGYQWTAPMVMVVLITFAAGLLMGVLGMVPRWWRQRRAAAQARNAAQAMASTPSSTTAATDTNAPPYGL